jgi:hypothetical protein
MKIMYSEYQTMLDEFAIKFSELDNVVKQNIIDGKVQHSLIHDTRVALWTGIHNIRVIKALLNILQLQSEGKFAGYVDRFNLDVKIANDKGYTQRIIDKLRKKKKGIRK